MSRVATMIAAVVATIVFGAASADAAVFEFTYSTIAGGSLTSSGSGDLTATSLGGGDYLATAAIGTFDGESISLIAPGGFAANDNEIFFTSSPVLDFSGLSFAAASANYNLYYDNGRYVGPGYAICTLCAGGNETLLNFTLKTVPEPSTWALMALGFAGLGIVGYRRMASASRAA